MIAGVTLEEACLALPSTTGTRPSLIRKALLPFGWTLLPRRRAFTFGWHHLGRVQWERHRHHGHLFVVDANGTLLDPYFGVNPTWRSSAWVTSYYRVQPCPDPV